ncbi:MAG: hypothetical protein K0S24_2807 [Sphingobacterium sp.]|jgi:hypothetical protein|nr:hypothetical protein [Sphingobacterium sp.]
MKINKGLQGSTGEYTGSQDNEKPIKLILRNIN